MITQASFVAPLRNGSRWKGIWKPSERPWLWWGGRGAQDCKAVGAHVIGPPGLDARTRDNFLVSSSIVGRKKALKIDFPAAPIVAAFGSDAGNFGESNCGGDRRRPRDWAR